MGKKAVLLWGALLLLLLCSTRLCCRVSVNGQEQEGLYSLFAVDRAATAAARAADELSPGAPLMPQIRRSYRLSLRAPDGDEQALADTLLQAVPGIKLADVVFVNGLRLGTVEDGEELFRRLQSYIENQQPHAAVSGSISGELRVKKLYTLASPPTNYDDMLLLVTGVAPVIYVDANGRLA